MSKKNSKKNSHKKKAQGSLETLLLFGGAILLAAIVIFIIIGISSSSKKSTEEHTNAVIKMSDTVVPAVLYSVSCVNTECSVFFQSFSNGTNELVIDKNVEDRTEITDNKSIIASALTIGKHSAYVLTTHNGGSAMSNIYNWEVTVGETPPEPVTTPVANPGTTEFDISVSVSLTCATADANIYYTTDGSTPNNGSTLYNSSIVISETTTLKAIAYVGSTSSTVMSATYTKNSASEITLSFEPPSRTPVMLEEAIKINTNPETIKIYYTSDGSNPTKDSPPYEGEIKIADNFTRIKAIAYKDAIDSGVQTAEYTVKEFVADPIAEPGQGLVSPGTRVLLSTTTPDAIIFYTTDGSDPNTGSQLYNEPIRIEEYTNIKAIAVIEGSGLKSGIVSLDYDIGVEVSTPTSDPHEGTYPEKIKVQLLTETYGARIFYTLDGSTPSSSSTRYETEIEITENTTLKAIAVLDETTSGVMTETYIFE